MAQHAYPKLHNAMWPGLVGKGSPGAEPAIDLDTMLELTAQASVDGAKFDGVDLFLFDPHVSIDASDADLKRLADKIAAKGFVVGSLVAPVWPPTNGGSAMGTDEERKKFLTQVRKACAIGRKLRDFGIRKYGVVRIDSALHLRRPKRDGVEALLRQIERLAQARMAPLGGLAVVPPGNIAHRADCVGIDQQVECRGRGRHAHEDGAQQRNVAGRRHRTLPCQPAGSNRCAQTGSRSAATTRRGAPVC